LVFFKIFGFELSINDLLAILLTVLIFQLDLGEADKKT